MVRNKDILEKLDTALEEIVLLRCAVKDLQSELDGLKEANADHSAKLADIAANMDTVADAAAQASNAVTSGVDSIMNYNPFGGGK